MSVYSPSIEKLIEGFERLPSIGHKTAVRVANGMQKNGSFMKKQKNLFLL